MRPRNSVFSVIDRLATSTTPTAGGGAKFSADAADQRERTVPTDATASISLSKRIAAQVRTAMAQDHRRLLNIVLSTIHHTSDLPRTICLFKGRCLHGRRQ